MKYDKKKVKAYMCATDWIHEIEHTTFPELYYTLGELKKDRKCWKQCGVIEIELTMKKWVIPSDFSNKEET